MGESGSSTKLVTMAASVVAIVLLLIVCLAERKSPQEAVTPVDDWDLNHMIGHLRSSGLAFRAVATRRGHDTPRNAFLTTTNRGWQELNGLPKIREEAALWQGTLYVERGRLDHDWSIQTRLWGDCCLAVGPFLFFGDPHLLERVASALGYLDGGEPRRVAETPSPL